MNSLNLAVTVVDGLVNIYEIHTGIAVFRETISAHSVCDIKELARIICADLSVEVDDAGNGLRRESFVITALSRSDLEHAGIVGPEESNDIDSDTMIEIAEKMENDYLDQLYWESLGIIASDIMADSGDNEDDARTD